MTTVLRRGTGTELWEVFVLGSVCVKGKEPVIYALEKGYFFEGLIALLLEHLYF